mgnify:CR=1 FL=1
MKHDFFLSISSFCQALRLVLMFSALIVIMIICTIAVKMYFGLCLKLFRLFIFISESLYMCLVESMTAKQRQQIIDHRRQAGNTLDNRLRRESSTFIVCKSTSCKTEKT